MPEQMGITLEFLKKREEWSQMQTAALQACIAETDNRRDCLPDWVKAQKEVEPCIDPYGVLQQRQE